MEGNENVWKPENPQHPKKSATQHRLGWPHSREITDKNSLLFKIILVRKQLI